MSATSRTPRHLRSAVDLVAEIGALAFELQHRRDDEIDRAVVFLRRGNGPRFDWLVTKLSAPQASERTTDADSAAIPISERTSVTSSARKACSDV